MESDITEIVLFKQHYTKYYNIPLYLFRQQIIMLEEGMLEGMSWVVREIKFLREEMKEVQGAVNRLTLGLQEEREKQESAEQDSIVVLELLRKKIDASEMKILSLEKDEKERGDDYLELLKGEIKTRTWHDSQQASKVEDLERRVGESISELESIISDLQNRPPDRSTTDTDMALSPLSPPSYSSQAPGTPSTAIKLTDNQHIFDKISANTECIEELQHEFSLLGKLFENTRQSASTEMTKLDLQLKQYVDQKLTQS